MQYEIENEIFSGKGKRWLVRKARTVKDAQQAVNDAITCGTLGFKRTSNGVTIADVIEVDKNGNEKKPK